MQQVIDTIGTNDSVVISDLADLYAEYSAGVYDIFIPFSATSVSSVTFEYEDEYNDCISGYSLEKLTNQNNIPNLYALNIKLKKYFYHTDEESYRDIEFSMTANTMSAAKYQATTFTIRQKGCLLYNLTFDWGTYNTISQDGKNYNIEYHAGSNILSSDKKYTINDIYEEGLGWNGKFYYDSDFTYEVKFDIDRILSDTTIYADVFAPILFKVIDAKTEDTLDSATFVINGSKIESVFLNDIYIIKPPFSDSATNFELVVSRDGYNDKHGVYEVENLYKNGKPEPLTIRLERLQGPGEFTITFEWSGRVDFDPYIQIFDGNMNLLNQDRVSGILTRPANLYYEINRKGYLEERVSELDREWAEESGYNKWLSGQGIDKKAYAAIKCDEIFYELDYDYRGQDNREPVEHVSGKVKLNDDRVYRVMLNDCDEGARLSSLGSKVTLVLENVEYPPFEAYEDKVYWTVFDIKKINGIWTAVTIDEYSDMAQPGFIGCPEPACVEILRQVETWDNAGEIVEGRTDELTFSNYKSGYEMEFKPSVTGSYDVNITLTEGVGYPCLAIYSGSSQQTYMSFGPDVSVDSRFNIITTQPHIFKFVLWTGGEGGGKVSINITKTS